VATNTNFQDGKKRDEGKKTHLTLVCPSCGKTAHIDRKYCDCHADLRHAAVTTSLDPPDVGPCNFEAPGLHCGDCPEACMYCASFGLPQTNGSGYGGKDCRHNLGIAKCHCCQSQITIAINLRSVSLSKIISEVRKEKEVAEKEEAENLFARAASVIYDEITKPILFRISQKRVRAG
jgi:hypothetical protein